jgi:Fe-S cluster biosynthesis and repair protein YggX
MFPTKFASVTAEITMHSRHITKMDIYQYPNQWGRQLLKVKRVNQPAWKVRQTVVEQQCKVKRANHLAWKVRQAVAKQQGKVKRVNSLTWKVRQSVPIK